MTSRDFGRSTSSEARPEPRAAARRTRTRTKAARSGAKAESTVARTGGNAVKRAATPATSQNSFPNVAGPMRAEQPAAAPRRCAPARAGAFRRRSRSRRGPSSRRRECRPGGTRSAEGRSSEHLRGIAALSTSLPEAKVSSGRLRFEGRTAPARSSDSRHAALSPPRGQAPLDHGPSG